jgi:hypothetical protein
MPVLTNMGISDFEREIMPAPAIATHIYDLVQAQGDEIVPVALPELEAMFFHKGQRFEIAQGVTRILFVLADTPLVVRFSENRSPDLDQRSHWWHYYRTTLCVNGLTRGITLSTAHKPKHGWSALMDSADAYAVAGRLKSGYDKFDREGHLPGHCPKLHVEDTSVAMGPRFDPETPGIDHELVDRALVGWDAVKKLDIRLAAGKSTLAHFCRAGSQIPDSVVDVANKTWGTHFDPSLLARYRILADELEAMEKTAHVGSLRNADHIQIQGA